MGSAQYSCGIWTYPKWVFLMCSSMEEHVLVLCPHPLQVHTKTTLFIWNKPNGKINNTYFFIQLASKVKLEGCPCEASPLHLLLLYSCRTTYRPARPESHQSNLIKRAKILYSLTKNWMPLDFVSAPMNTYYLKDNILNMEVSTGI